MPTILYTVALTLLAIWATHHASTRSADAGARAGWRRLNLVFLMLLLADGLQVVHAGSAAPLPDAIELALAATHVAAYALLVWGVLTLTRVNGTASTSRLDGRLDAAVVVVAGAVVLLAVDPLPLSAGIFDASFVLPVAAARWAAYLMLVFGAAVIATSPRRPGSPALLIGVGAELAAGLTVAYLATDHPRQLTGATFGLHAVFLLSVFVAALSAARNEPTAGGRIGLRPSAAVNPVPYLAVAVAFSLLTLRTAAFASDLFITGAAALCSAALMRQFVLQRTPAPPEPPQVRTEGDRLHSLLANSSDLIVVLNPDGTARYLSPSITSILGYGAAAFWSRSLFEFVHPEDLPDMRTLLRKAQNDGSGVVLRGEWRVRDATAKWVHLEAMVSDHTTEAGIDGLLLNIRNVTERKVLERKLLHQTRHDPLTGLANRTFLMDRIEQAVARVRREQRLVALLFLDLDDFKQVNDTFGHDEGDRLLEETAMRLLSSCRSSDTVARLGGDEFAVLLDSPSSAEEAEEVAERILQNLRSPYPLLRGRFLPSTSIGLAFLDPAISGQELLRRADVAMYAAKVQGKNGVRVFAQGMDEPLKRQMRLQNDLHAGLERGELSPYYHPIVALATSQVVGVEALVRWQHPEFGLLRPDAFLPAAQNAGLMVPLGNMMLRESCLEANGWRRSSPGKEIFLSVNLAEEQIRRADMVENIRATVRDAGFPEHLLVLEIAENALVNDEASRQRLRELQDLGIRIAIDDFGTQYSSLSYLRSLPIHWLKLDRSFVRHLDTDEKSRHIVRAVVELCRSLDVQVIAEGVETEAQRDVLLDLDCEFGQGFFYVKPKAGYEFRRLLQPDLQIDEAAAAANDALQLNPEQPPTDDGPPPAGGHGVLVAQL